MKIKLFITSLLCIMFFHNMTGQQDSLEHSVARQWNEIVLESIRNDLARPTVHARNLFHTSAAMYDAWTIINGFPNTYFGNVESEGFEFDVESFMIPDSVDMTIAQETAISYACYRIVLYRFRFSPGVQRIYTIANELFQELGYDPDYFSTDLSSGDPAALGNYIAEKVIEYGQADNSNELRNYANTYYLPVNNAFAPKQFGNQNVSDFNRWQPLSLDLFIDQSGNPSFGRTPEFLSPEWGNVTPFAMQEDDLTIYNRDGFDYKVYHDPGPPPFIEDAPGEGGFNDYQWGFAMVSAWGSHLDPTDGVMIDISPATVGNNPELPTDIAGLRDFYQFEEGGDSSRGHDVNPVTGEPYEANMVLRGDFTRVLAEFWADGPDSETPPGHWFTIMNDVMDHPLFIRKFEGKGEDIEPLEYDIKAYFTLGGAMHDAAISAWGIKGWYDYIRPVSAIRAMAELGQCTDTTLTNYDHRGLPLIDGFIEVITAEDHNPPYIDTSELIFVEGERVPVIGQLKLRTWVGPDYIRNPEIDQGGVQWIQAGRFWPFQRPTFITPNFAGYVSGHSTYSRAASEVLTLLTGDPYFPGGMGEFVAHKNEFLVFEEGPSEDIVLQWATYQDASDQTSLSRIWGGIHPPADDIPGRLIGKKIGVDAYFYARTFFKTSSVDYDPVDKVDGLDVFPNPINRGDIINIVREDYDDRVELRLTDLQGRVLYAGVVSGGELKIPTSDIPAGVYILNMLSETKSAVAKVIIQ